MKQNKNNMLTGSLWKGILLFAIPLAFTSLLQQLFHSVDMMVVGSYCGPNELAAVGSNGAVVNLFINIFLGLSIGSNVVIGHLLGEGKTGDAKKAMHTCVALSIICGALVSILGIIFSRKLLELISSPPEVIDLATLYLRIYFSGMFFQMIYNFSAAIARSIGKTTIPFICLTIGGVLNIFLNLLFVIVFRMSVAGVGIATTISNAVSCVLILLYLFKNKSKYKLNIKEVKIHKDIFKNVLKQGVPMSINAALYPISNMMVQSGINSLGAVVVAGNAAAAAVETYATTFTDSFCQADLNFVSLNKGAKNYKRCIQASLISLFYYFIFLNAINLTMYSMRYFILGCFSSDPDVIFYGIERMKFMYAFYSIVCVQSVATNTLRGLGHPVPATVTSIICTFGIRIIWIYTVFKAYPTYKTILASYPIAWGMVFIILTIYTIFIFKKEMSIEKNNEMSVSKT